MDELVKIVNEFEEVVNKLDGWYNYYKDEDLMRPARPEMDGFGKPLEDQISSLKMDVVLLRMLVPMVKINASIREHFM